MRPKICGCRSFFGNIGISPEADRICLRKCCLRASHSARLRYVFGVKWVSVLGVFVLRASCAGICAQALHDRAAAARRVFRMFYTVIQREAPHTRMATEMHI